MAKTEEQPVNKPSEDKLAQLTAADVLNIVSKAAQHAARTAADNDSRETFIKFNAYLVEQLGGKDAEIG